MTMWTWAFWREALDRAVRTAAQSTVALWAVDGVGLLEVDVPATFSAVGMAAVLSLLTSIGLSGVGREKGTPSVL